VHRPVGSLWRNTLTMTSSLTTVESPVVTVVAATAICTTIASSISGVSVLCRVRCTPSRSGWPRPSREAEPASTITCSSKRHTSTSTRHRLEGDAANSEFNWQNAGRRSKATRALQPDVHRLSFGPPDLNGSAPRPEVRIRRSRGARGVRGAREQGRGRGSETCALSYAAISSGAIQLQTRLDRKCDSDAHRFFWQSSANFAVLRDRRRVSSADDAPPSAAWAALRGCQQDAAVVPTQIHHNVASLGAVHQQPVHQHDNRPGASRIVVVDRSRRELHLRHPKTPWAHFSGWLSILPFRRRIYEMTRRRTGQLKNRHHRIP